MKIKVYCGENVESEETPMHPKHIVEKAVQLIQELKQLTDTTLPVEYTCATHSFEFIMAIKYIGRKQGVETEFFLNDISYGDSIEEICADFNRGLDLINELGDTEE